MKKNYLIIAFLFSSMMFGQSSTFTNASGAGDGKWSTATNWSAGLPSGTGVATISANVDLDVNVPTLGQITSGTNTVTTSNNSKVTIQTTSSTATPGLLCNSANFNYNAPIEFNNGGTATNVKTLQVNNTLGAPYRQLTLGPNSVLTLNSLMRTVLQFDSKVVFQGKIDGSLNLQFQGASEFATTADNTGYNADFVVFGASASIVSNTTVDGGFLKAGRKVQVNATGGSLTLNGANSCDGNLVLAPIPSFTLNINANQESFGYVFLGNGPLTINVAPAVTNLSFANSAGNTWGTGTLTITGYQSGKIRFGIDNTGLTAQQLLQITADGAATGQALALDANGYLVLASSLSTDSFALENQKRISYPTIVDNQIYLSKPQNNIEIMDMTGRKIIKISNQNGIDAVTTSELNSGMYFIVFDGVKVEKFIKK